MQAPFRPIGAVLLPSRIDLAPVSNALNSLALLNAAEQLPGTAPWVHHTAAALSPAQRQANQLIFGPLGAALLLEGSWADFPSYLESLATQHPQTLRERVLTQHAGAPVPSAAAVLLDDPFHLHDTIVAHLRELWEHHLAAEWTQQQRQLQRRAALLPHPLLNSGLAPATIMGNLHRLIGSAAGYAPGAQEIVFVPSPHVGRHISQLQDGTTLLLFFDAELHSAALLRDTPMKQIELVGRLGALSEPTRLRVLALLAQHGELTLQDLMTQLDTSQPNVSRYLKALSGFVEEQRKDGRKRYRLVPSQLDLTFQALQQQVLAPPAPTVPQEDQMTTQGPARFLDPQGVVIVWPGQRDDRHALLRHLASHFAQGQSYSEQEVNQLLMQYVAAYARDHVTVRRDLIDAHLLQRSEDGARYWRNDAPAQQPERQLSDEEAYARYWGGGLPDTTT